MGGWPSPGPSSSGPRAWRPSRGEPRRRQAGEGGESLSLTLRKSAWYFSRMEIGFAWGVLVVALLWWAARRWSMRREEKSYQQWHRDGPVSPFSARQNLLSRAELAFYRALLSAVGDQTCISMKVRLADLVHCDEQAWKAGFARLVTQKHIDFVLCDPATSRILVAIELDDQSHQYVKRQSRDDFVNQLFGSTGIPFMRVRAAASYDPARIREAFRQALLKAQQRNQDSVSRTSTVAR